MNWKQLLCEERIGEQSATRHAARSVFEQDYDRIIFSQSFRSLQDKTQVFPLAGQEFAHTRLTHSLEVSSVGRSLGREAGQQLIAKYPDLTQSGFTSHDFGAIVAAAALAHDIGNPPFGHAGEAGIADFFNGFSGKDLLISHLSEKEWHDIANFEGNAQGFRLLNKNKSQGLRLTCATLGAFTKYPRESKIGDVNKSRKSQKKYGFLQGNSEDFYFVASRLGLKHLGNADNRVWCRHPLAFLVEAADDICYTIIDLEDGANLGWLPFEETRDLLGAVLGAQYRPDKLDKISSITEKTGMMRALAIRELIRQVVEVFLAKEEEMLEGAFDSALTDSIPAAEAIRNIRSVSLEKIYRSRQVIEREVAGFEVLHGLLSAFVPGVIKQHQREKLSWKENCMMRLLPADTRNELDSEDSLYYNMLTLLDFVSGLTDSKALNLFRNIRGIALPGNR